MIYPSGITTFCIIKFLKTYMIFFNITFTIIIKIIIYVEFLNLTPLLQVRPTYVCCRLQQKRCNSMNILKYYNLVNILAIFV